jgi:uncharacterized protein
MSVFVDSTAFVALVVTPDQHHAEVTAEWTSLLRAHERLVTTSYVVLETVAVVQKRFGIEVAVRFTRDILPLVEVWWVDERRHEEGMLIWQHSNRRALSLTDCVSFAAMTAASVSSALSCDRHFAEQGFEVLP